jgi:hypothetical protein
MISKKVKFPNESEWCEISIDITKFRFFSETETEIWGWYKKTFLAIKKDSHE